MKSTIVAVCVCLLLCCFTGAAFTQEIKLQSDGQTMSGQPLKNNESQTHNAPAGVVAPAGNIPMWAGFFIFANTQFNFTMVGSDPTIAGAGTTNVPVWIIPLAFNYNGTVVSTMRPACNDNVNVLTRVQNSPLFTQNVTWVEGNTVVGVTQFTDAFQRANFWSIVSGRSPNYHVLLNPVTTLAQQTINIPAPPPPNTQLVNNNACPQQPIGSIDFNFLDGQLRGLITRLGVPSNVLPLFLAYDMVAVPAGGGAALGYHTAFALGGGVFQTYSFGSYVDPGLLGFNVADISILSHELGEWMDDPINNQVPSWGHIGQVTGCQSNLEVGDPLTGSNSIVTTPGFNYHVQDLAFFSWFARQSPSIAVNGWYSTLNAFASPPPICR